MSIYEEVKQNVSVLEAARRYGLEVKRGNMAVCPFHQDRAPSLKLYEDHFYCFGCQCGGDVVTFTAKLLGLGNYQAAKRLQEDFGSLPVRSVIPPRPVSRESLCLGVINRYIRLLRQWQKEYEPKPGEPMHERFIEALQMLPSMEDLSDLLTYGPPVDRALAADKLMENRSFQWLKDRLDSPASDPA